MGRGKIPIACTGRYLTVNPAREAQPLADECDPHGYLTKPGDILKYSGHPVVERVFANMVRYLEGMGER